MCSLSPGAADHDPAHARPCEDPLPNPRLERERGRLVNERLRGVALLLGGQTPPPPGPHPSLARVLVSTDRAASRPPPISAVTGIMPHPYVTKSDSASKYALSSSGTVMKYQGAGPRQYQISPENSTSFRPLATIRPALP